MKVWVIARSYPIAKNKMRGSFELEQAKLLANAGNDVTFIAVVFHPINRVNNWGYSVWQDGKVKVYIKSVFFAPERCGLHMKGFQRKQWEKMMERVADEQGVADVIHVHYPAMVSDVDAVLAYQNRGTKIVITEHWSKTLKNTMDDFQREQLRKYVNNSDAVICVSEPLKKSITEITGTEKSISVVPNVVSAKFRCYSKETGEFRFVCVGRLAPIKQFDKVVQAFANVFRDYSAVTLTIVGGGEEKRKLEALIRHLAMEKQVKLTGVLSHERTAEEIQESNVLICYSEMETFGVPVIEAWACGKPTIVADSVGLIGYWRDSFGEIVSCRDTHTLEVAMKKVYSQKDNYNSKAIAEFAKHTFGEKAICEQLEKIYLQCVK